MPKSPEELLAMRFGGATVAENLKRAVESGKLIEDDDGFLSLRDGPPTGNWAIVTNGPSMGSNFLYNVVYQGAYARSAVPHGCQACYKVKVALKNLRELVAAWGVGKQIQCYSKWGVDFYNQYSQDIYAGYFYISGLEQARALFRVVRTAVDNEPKLGRSVAMSIKRGCSEYEATLGPSDKYEFTPEMGELEAYLKSRYRSKNEERLPPVPLAHWIDVAFRIGDDTYLDFTGGKRLHPKMLDYSRDGSERLRSD